MIKISPELLEKIKSGKGHAEIVDLTPETKARLHAASVKILNLLTTETRGPSEAYAVITMLRYGLEQTYGIQGYFGIPNDESEH